MFLFSLQEKIAFERNPEQSKLGACRLLRSPVDASPITIQASGVRLMFEGGFLSFSRSPLLELAGGPKGPSVFCAWGGR